MKRHIISLLAITLLSSANVEVISKNEFFYKDELEVIPYPFILVELKDNGSGLFYFMEDPNNIFSGLASGGAKSSPTPEGIFRVKYRKKFHMSTKYPDPSGINNMDNMLNITDDGIALHKGSVGHLSHGCIHIEPNKSRKLFNMSFKDIPVIITNNSYREFISR